MTPDTNPGAMGQWASVIHANDAFADAIDAEDRALRDLLRQCLTAMVNAALHVEDLRDAWERGALSEHDGKGGTRSNLNMDIVLELKAAIPAAQKALEGR